MPTFEEVVSNLLELPALHARFVNTLSFLEYLGARKILKSQKVESVSNELLAHAAEEIRHAQMFKRLALKLSNGELETYRAGHLLCGVEAHSYIDALDEAGAAALGTRGEWTNYLVTTLLIEERAAVIYPTYRKSMDARGISNPLGAIIRDEDQHLDAIRSSWEETGLSVAMLDHLRSIEQDHFFYFLNAVAVAASNCRPTGLVREC